MRGLVIELPRGLYEKMARAVIGALGGAPDELLSDGVGNGLTHKLSNPLDGDKTLLLLNRREFVLLSAAFEVGGAENSEIDDAEYDEIQNAITNATTPGI